MTHRFARRPLMVLIMSLAACGSPSQPASPEPPAHTTETRVVALSQPDAGVSAAMPTGSGAVASSDGGVADAGALSCRRVSASPRGSAPLTIQERERRLWLVYDGGEEESGGKYWPMQAKLSGRTILVTIASQSRPSDPHGVTLSAIMSNFGEAELPARDGAYVLDVRQGQAHATYALDVSPTIVEITEKVPKDSRLALGEPRRARRLPPDALTLRCQALSPCGERECAKLFSSTLAVSLTDLPDGPYLSDLLSPREGSAQCNLNGTSADLSRLDALVRETNATACASAAATLLGPPALR